jgi:hypothetical protein
MEFSGLELPPGLETLADQEALLAELKADVSGDRARTFIAHFGKSEIASRQMLVRTTDFEERRLAGLLSDAWINAQEVIRLTWAQLHERSL